METNKHYVYVLECSDGSYYTGYARNVQNRLFEHQSGKGAKYTRGRTPVKLIYQQEFQTRSDAMKEEYKIKRLSRKQKEDYLLKRREK